MNPSDHWLLIHRSVTLVLRTIHLDKAGETSDVQRVLAEVADVDENGVALVVTEAGLPVTIPAGKLFPLQPLATPPASQSFVAGHELFRNFHPSGEEPRTTRRWLERAEFEELLAE